MDEPKKKQFLWGVLLAWIPAIPLVLAFAHMVADLSTSKATGLGAVAGGLAQAYLTLGVGLTLVLEMGAIVLLLRAFSRQHLMRAVFSVISICCSTLIIFLFGLFVWFFLLKLPHTG